MMDNHRKSGVLIVDDRISNIMIITEILRPEYNVYTANNGPDGIEAAEKYLPDVILLDIIMP